ncbi:MAG: S8 family serine peptidase [Rhodospirillales bacterium]|nr:S8 family serine peptidase [Rhodospirillales bacterium]
MKRFWISVAVFVAVALGGWAFVANFDALFSPDEKVKKSKRTAQKSSSKKGGHGVKIGTGDRTKSGAARAPSSGTAETGAGGGGGQAEPVSPGAGIDFEIGEIVVADPPPGFAAAAALLNFATLDTANLGALGMIVLRMQVPPGQSVPAALATVAGQFPGIAADANHLYELAQNQSASAAKPDKRPLYPTPEERGQSWALWAAEWKNSSAICGAGARLGMIDTSVDTRHPALRGQKVTFRSFHNPKRKQGPSGHGTAIAAMMVGKLGRGWGGLLPGAQLLAANIFERMPNGRLRGNVFAMLRGVDWLVGEKVQIINLSIAGKKNKIVQKAVRRASLKKVILIAAAGNWGRRDRPAYPAAYGSVIAVTAVDSNFRIYRMANMGAYVDFAMPGVEAWTAAPGGGGRYQSGTSFAAPFISALAGYEIAKDKKSVNSQTLKKRLAERARDLGQPGKDDVFGWGFVERGPECT